MSSPGYFTPEDQEQLSAIQRRQAYARALLQQGNADTSGAYGGLKNAGSAILGAILANKADASEKTLTQSAAQKYQQDLGSFLSGTYGQTPVPPAAAPATPETQISNNPGSGPIMQQAASQPPQAGAPPPSSTQPPSPPQGGQQPPVSPQAQAVAPNPMAALLATHNPALMQQFGPTLFQHQLDINDKKIIPLSDQEAASLGLRPGGVYGREAATGNLAVIQPSDMKSQGAIQQGYDIARNTPQTPEQIAQAKIAQQNANAAMISATKPQFVPYGTPGYMQGGKYTAIPQGGVGGGSSSAFGEGDPNSPSINGQLGLSSNGFNLLTGNTSAVARGRPMDLASKEVDSVIQKRGLDPSIVKPRVQAYSDAVKMNTLKSNTMDTLANEIKGTVQNLAPVADNLGGGNLRWVNGAAQFAGGLANNPNAQQYAFYLNQLRADLAGFNATSGGKIGMHGQVQTDNADFATAEKVIKDGLDRGGAKGLADAIEATRQKNVAVVEKQTQEATKGIWNALGLGPQYDKLHGAPSPGIPAPGNGNASKVIRFEDMK